MPFEKREFGDRGGRGGFNRGGFDRGPREMHKATCSDCKKECEVPFKPTEGRPVFCKECFMKHRDDSR
ncbi:MAG: CxxC-x17-CxxC domain-containing protein [Candidatus Aenigmatarchaeota archaeon]